MSGDNDLLTVENLTKVYFLGGGLSRQRLEAVRNAGFSLDASQPEIFTLAGESGSGKTTLAKMILGFVEPTHGSLLYKGANITHIKRRRDRMQFMREIQPVFQNPFETFNPLKKVETYLYETAVNYGIVDNRKQAAPVIDDSLRKVGLSLVDVRGKYPNEFSGGQLQRVSVARSLITQPSLLITDEPVSMVDASLRMSIVNLFKDLKETQGVSVIYITHDLATAYYVSDRIAIMLRGNIVEMGTVDQVLLEPLHPYTRILKSSVPEPDPEHGWKDEIALTDIEAAEYARVGCKFAGRCPSVMDACGRQEPADLSLDGRMVRCHLYAKQNKTA